MFDRQLPEEMGMSQQCSQNYRRVAEIWGRYWRAYGGFSAVLTPPYFHVALICTTLTFPFWRFPNWWDVPLGVLPNLLGFTLGGMAVLIGISEARVIRTLSHQEPDKAASDLTIIV